LNFQEALKTLNPAKAEYHAVLKDQCAEYTRVDIQKLVAAHLSKGDNRFVWLKGSAGVGKTAIAKSLCSELEDNHRLAASFFFDKNRNQDGVDSTDHFISTLAYQLADFDSRYRQSLIRILRAKGNILRRPLRDQLQSLIVEPMREVFEGRQYDGTTHVIIIDGLDECSEKSSLDDLMDLITGLDGLPSHFITFVSSRPVPEIRDSWQRCEKTPLTENLDGVKAEPDIRIYVIQRLTDYWRRRPSPRETAPSQHDMESFANRCGGLFVVARIRVREVENARRMFAEPSIDVFRRMLDDVAGSVKDLDQEYLRIFSHAYLRDSVHEDTRERFRRVMSTVLAMHKPLSTYGISQLLDEGEARIEAVLDPISSVLNIPPATDQPVQFYHSTTREFLQRPKFWEDHPEEGKLLFFPNVKGFLAPYCLNMLRKTLPRPPIPSNLADIDAQYFSIQSRFKDTMAFHVEGACNHIRYAVLYFLSHLTSSHYDAQDILCTFLNEILLPWMLAYSTHGGAGMTNDLLRFDVLMKVAV